MLGAVMKLFSVLATVSLFSLSAQASPDTRTQDALRAANARPETAQFLSDNADPLFGCSIADESILTSDDVGAHGGSNSVVLVLKIATCKRGAPKQSIAYRISFEGPNKIVGVEPLDLNTR
jgi:hypothetical protein